MSIPPPEDYPLDYGDYPPPPGVRPRGDNGVAIASLVCSLAGFVCCGVPSLVGLVLGIVALRQIERTGQRGRGLALAGAIAGAVVGLLWSPFWIYLIVEIVSSIFAGLS